MGKFHSHSYQTAKHKQWCVCVCTRARERYTRERDLLHTACLDSEKYVHVYDTCTYMHEEPLNNSLSSQLHSEWYLPLFSFYGWCLGSLRLFFTLIQAFLLLFLPPSCFQNKAAVSESMLHLVKANAREKHKAPGLTKFLTTLFPKQPFWIFFLCTLSIKHALSTAFVNMAMSARKKQLQYVSTGCLCFTAVNTSFIWGFTVNHLCNLLSAHFWFAYCNPREAIHRWAACRMSRFAYVSTSLNLANLR